MGQTASNHHHARGTQEALRAERSTGAEFKPLALPALAAAVEMAKRGARRPAAERQIPAILRIEAFVD